MNRPYGDRRKPGRRDEDGVEWWACDPYPTWYRWENGELFTRWDSKKRKWLDPKDGRDGERIVVAQKPLTSTELDMIESRARNGAEVGRSEIQRMVNEIREHRAPHCICCGSDIVIYCDRNGDDWCKWCHDNGMCSLEDGHTPPAGMSLWSRLRCHFRGYHYLDNMGGIWCCHECGIPLNPGRVGANPGEEGPPWRSGGPWE